MGIDIWVRRNVEPDNLLEQKTISLEEPLPHSVSKSDEIVLQPESYVETTSEPAIENSSLYSDYDLDRLRNEVEQCQKCQLCQTRNNSVFGYGSDVARLMIIGEAPGADEDREGLPFVGRAGKLLDNMLLAIKLNREIIYIANILKCRPPNNRDPQVAEVEACTPYLERQIELIQPDVILVLGRVAAHYLLQTDAPLSRLRGTQTVYGKRSTPVVITYHPAYLLRSPDQKRKSWEDLKMVKRILSKK
ncbi:MAG: uracil-DNA glycosylase [Gammaproteobacteria bacterium]|nr:MAG: uracil-DNA glycosylase [Gammaproteobacteria bacterium]